MVLQLCGRVCRRLSFENPSWKHGGFFVYIEFEFYPNLRDMAIVAGLYTQGNAQYPGCMERMLKTQGIYGIVYEDIVFLS